VHNLGVNKGDFANAIEAARQALDQDPNNLPAKLIRSSAMIATKDYTKARTELETILKANPEARDAQFQMGMLNFNERKFKEAEDAFRRLHKSSPTDPRGLAGVVEVLVAQGRYDEASQILEGELAKADRPELRLSLANISMQANKLDKAIGIYQEHMAKYPKATFVAVRLAEAQRRKGDMQGAIATLTKASELAPDDANAKVQLAITLDGQGARDKAQPIYEEVLKRVPDNWVALNNLAYILAEKGADLDQALGYATRAKQQVPDSLDISDTLGWIYIKKNLPDSAIPIFQDLVKRSPERAAFHFHLAMALFQKGDRQGARRSLDTAIKKNPSKDEEAKIRDLMAKVGS